MNKHNLRYNVLDHDAFWAIYAPAGQMLWEQLGAIDAIRHREEFEARARAEDSAREKPYTMNGGIAIISLLGPLTKSVASLEEGTSTVRARRLVRQAASDPDVSAILLVIDSPGGSVSGTNDLAEDVAEAAAKKPIYAYCEDYCCSAAYWIGSQATALYANKTAIIGSIGTYMVVSDYSEMADNLGIKVHVLSTGPQKGAGVPGAEVTDAHLAAFQETVNDLNEHFLAGVARGRHMGRARISELATGNVWIGEQAVSNGLIDGVAAIDEVMQSLRKSTMQGKVAASQTSVPVADLPSQNNLAQEQAPYAGATLEQRLESACAVVEGANSELANVITLRATQGRTLGPTRLEQMHRIHFVLGQLIAGCEAHLVAPSAEAEPAEATQDKAAKAALEQALADVDDILTTAR